MTPQEFAHQLVPQTDPTTTEAKAFAPANIALCKYWGKQEGVASPLNLPTTPSLSISLGDRGSHVCITPANQNTLTISEAEQNKNSQAFQRTFNFLSLFTPHPLAISSDNNIPTAAGLASSASYFAALTLACNQLFSWGAPPYTLSCLARLGSGSACRSISPGFVVWEPHPDPFQSYGVPLETTWEALRIGLLIINSEEKPISSREAMEHTKKTSPLYTAWAENAFRDFASIKKSIENKDLRQVGQTSEYNALALHAVMLSARPAVIYSLPQTWEDIQKIQGLRNQGVPVYFTQDAGANLKLLFLDTDTQAIQAAFPTIEVIAPFKA